MNVHYFSPGPSSLPKEVKESIHHDMLDTFGMGVSVMEISHRSKQYESLNEETHALARKVFQVPSTHALFFTPFGAQQHFSLCIQHFSLPTDTISYTDTGIWAHLACEEALLSGRKSELIFNGAPSYTSLGHFKNWIPSKDTKFVHITVNNTVYGTEYAQIPTFGSIPVILDMTSSLGARTDIPWAETGLVYASAQKNFGIAGVSVVMMRKDLLENSRLFTKQNYLGKALCYHAISDTQSALNTPPVFAIFCMNRMLKWMDKLGGLSAMEQRALKKADLVYKAIDKGFYTPRAEKKYRSRHNFVFNLPSPSQEEHFIAEAAKHKFLEIKGYKTIGGIRASMYNGVNIESAKLFSEFLTEYALKFF